jgi:parallel beta-helix repeat protein
VPVGATPTERRGGGRLGRLLSLCLAAVATIAVVAPAARADTVTCGEVLHAHTTVTNSLVGCAGDGLVIGASGIDVNLNGHVIQGVGLGTGIRNGGHADVTIRNGSVINFDFGVVLQSGTVRNAVTNLNLSKNEWAAIQLENASGNHVAQNVVTETSDVGVKVTNGSLSNQIVGNSLSGAGSSEGFAVELGSNGNWLEGNVVPVSGGHAVRVEGSSGNMVLANELAGGADVTVMVAGSPGTVVQANRIAGGGDASVLMTGATGGVVYFNALGKSSDAGVILEGMGNSLVKGNSMSLAGDSAIVLRNGAHNVRVIDNQASHSSDAGVAIADGSGNTVRGNVLASNSVGVELSGGAGNVVEFNALQSNLGLGMEVVGSTSNTVFGNVLDSNGTGGLWVDTASVSNTIAGNSAQGNGGDGYSVSGLGTTVRSNLARTNGGWGIHAVAGVIDGGGNGASGNAELAQCHLILCSDGSGWQAPVRPPEPVDPLEVGLPTKTAVGPWSGFVGPTTPARALRRPARRSRRVRRARLAVVRCKARRPARRRGAARQRGAARRRGKVVCKARYKATRSTRRVTGRLVRHGKPVARGARRVRRGGQGLVALRGRGRPAAGRYRLVLSYRDTGRRKTVVRSTVRVRY